MSEQPRHECPHCGMVSAHPQDAAEGYCGNCHHFCNEAGELTIGQLAQQLPPQVWVDLPEYGVRVKRLPPFPP